jgi:outer membrane lipoprotein-sorting protein
MSGIKRFLMATFLCAGICLISLPPSFASDTEEYQGPISEDIDDNPTPENTTSALPLPDTDTGFSSGTLVTSDTTTSMALHILEMVEEKHKDLKTLAAEFDQVKTSALFEDDKTESSGKFFFEKPDRLRCDYDKPDPSSILFADKVLYQYVPSIDQVDKIVFKSDQDARAQLRMLLLGFGVSTEEVLQSYAVEYVLGHEGEKSGYLVFRPKDKEIAKTIKDISVWLTPGTLLPRKVRIAEPGDEVTTLTIREISKDNPIRPKTFVPVFPGNPDVVEHDR